jgi:signal transduction histidine kinase
MSIIFFYKRIILLTAISCCAGKGFSQKSITDLRTGLENETSVRAKADICFNIAILYSDVLKIDSALYYTAKIKDYSQQGNYESGTGRYYLAFATTIFYRSRYDEAEKNLLKAIEIFTRLKQNNFLGRAYLILGNVCFVTDRIALARTNYWTSVSLMEPAQDARGLYAAYLWLGRSYFKTSQTDSASFYCIKQLSIAEHLNDPDRIYLAGCTVGRSFLSLGEWDKAIRYFDQGLKYRTVQTDKVGLRGYLRDYAICLVLTHEYPRADSVIKEIESINAILGDTYGIIVINRLKGTMEYERKNYQDALMFLQQAFNRMHELKISNSETKDIILLLGKTEYENHSYDSATAHLKSAVQTFKELRAVTDEEEAALLISKSFQQKGNTDSALYYFKYYTVLKDSIVSQQKQKTIIEVTTRYETEKKEQVIKMLEKEKETDAYALALKNQQIEKQRLEGEKKSQELQLLSQQSEISLLEASEKTLALQNQEKEMLKKQKELELVSKQSQLEAAIAAKQSQQKEIAYVAVFAVLILGGIAFYRYRQSRKLGKQLAASLVSLKEAQDQLIKTEKEKEAENVRVRISRDIHDEVGATLSGVALFSEIAIQKMEQHEEDDAQLYLSHISANSKEMVDKMSDIVWAINPDNDSFERIIAKLQSYAFNLCAGKGIALHLDLDDTIRKHFPSMQIKRNLYLFMKEAINNAVKYSGGKNIFLTVQTKGDAIITEIRDDGKGFDTSVNYMGNGLKNMKARAGSLDGNLVIDSKNGKGTSIRLQFHPGGGQIQAV